MGLIAHTYDYNYFNGGGAIGGYDLYSATTYSSETAEQLAQKFLDKSNLSGVNLVGKKVLVLGCAYGFLVKYLIASGVDAYGMDWSAYAVSQAPPDIASKIMLGDAHLSADWTRIRTLAGLTKAANKFDLVIDEDMICCLSDADALTMKTLVLNNTTMYYHLLDQAPNLINWYNYHTISEWRALNGVSPKEKYFARFTWSEI